MSENLWPDDLSSELDPDSPLVILQEQAEALALRTHGLLQAEVVLITPNDILSFNFVLVAPALDDYRYRLFKVWPDNKLDPYPVTLDVSSADQRKAATAAEFREELRRIFFSNATRRAISELLGYTTAVLSDPQRAA